MELWLLVSTLLAAPSPGYRLCLLQTSYHVHTPTIPFCPSPALFPPLCLQALGFWKLSVSVLEDDDYFQLVSDFFCNWRHRRQSFRSLVEWWDEGKARIKGLTINYCKQHSQSKRLERDILDQLAAHLKVSVDTGCCSLLPIYYNTLDRIKHLDLEAARGDQVPAQVKWVEEGKSSTLYFLCLERKHSADCNVSALRAEGGSLVSDKDG